MSLRMLLRLLPALIWLALILVISSLPLAGWPLPGGLDKLLHGAQYSGLSVLVLVGLHANGARRLFLRALAAVPIMAVLAAADELHQRWIPGRSADPWDLMADVAGIVAGAGIVLVIVWARGRGGAKGKDDGRGG